MHFEIYESSASTDQDWRWRLKGGNGEIVASGEGYVSKANVERAIVRLKEDVATAPIRYL